MTLKSVVWLFIIAVAAFIVASQMAKAQPSCGPHDSLVGMIGDRFKESQAARGIANGALIELFVSQSGTWTMIATTGNGLSCIIAAGEGWEPIEIKPGQPL